MDTYFGKNYSNGELRQEITCVKVINMKYLLKETGDFTSSTIETNYATVLQRGYRED